MLWFFASTYVPDNHSFFGDLRAEAYILDETTDRWVSKGMAALDLYPMDTPKLMPNGNWIMGGLTGAARAAVAVSDGDDFTKWRTISLPQVPGGAFAETTVAVAEDRVLAVARSNRHVPDRALVYESVDQGENWTTERISNYPMTQAKPNLGILSNGRLYLLSNMGPNRNIPVIAYGDPGRLSLNRVFRLRPDVPSQPRFSGPNHKPEWAYYYSHEADGVLYIVYHHGKEDAELTVVPLSSLK